ncbi:MAG: DUF6159 family protein [Anaerolineales bacterium]|jgi:hypothetical protein
MMDSIRRGFGFLGQAYQMAVKDPDLIKPSIYALILGAVVSLIGSGAGIGLALLPGSRSYLPGIFLILSPIIFFLEYAVSYLFSGMTVRLVYDYLTQGDGRMDQAWAAAQREFFNIMTLAAASTLVKLLENLFGGGRRGRQSLLGGMLAGFLDLVWTTATFFVLPAMILEDLNLGQSLKRATQIIKNNLLLVAVTEIGVSGVVDLIAVVVIVLAFVLGGGIFYLAGVLSSWSAAGVIAGVGVAVLIAGVMIAAVTALSSYAKTAYHTCLFLWARQVEEARAQGAADNSIAAPAPLAAVI